MRSELEVDSQLERVWWELSNQLSETLSHGRRSVLFAISSATAYLSFVAATVTILNNLALWWVSAALTAVGIAILVFVWELSKGSLDGFFTP
jgi:vacuolar-type H+-ATPase subunit I/STV1